MALQKKYYFTFKQIGTDDINLVEIWQDTTDVLVAEEVRGMSSPFIVEMPSIDHKFQVVRGTGCEMTLLSETDMKFFSGLYHINPQEFQILHYVNSSLNWIGFLNSETYREAYDSDQNYGIIVTGNDGFALMDRFSFIDTGEVNYAGIKSEWELLQICLNKIGLPWVEILVSLSTTFADYSGAADSTILHESYIDCANFYDEDDKPMSLRAVIESILAPYGAYIRAENGNILITDIHTIAGGGSITYKRFNASTYVYIADVVVMNEKAVSDVEYHGTGQSIEISGGVNRQVIAYSPYPIKIAIPEAIKYINEFDTVPTTWSTKNGYFYKTLENNIYWDTFSPATFEASYYQSDINESYLRWPRLTVNQEIAQTIYEQYLSVSSIVFSGSGIGRNGVYNGLLFKISGKVLLKTKTNPYSDAESGINIYAGRIYCKINIGTFFGADNINPGNWIEDSSVQFYIEFKTSPIGLINDKFVDFEKIIYVGNPYVNETFSGIFGFHFMSDFEINKSEILSIGAFELNSSDVQEVWVKDVAIDIKRADQLDIVDQDIEYIGDLDKNFQNEGQKITLTSGTNTYFSDRAKILSFNGSIYSAIFEWTRAGQSYKIEELLLGSISSNYRAGYLTLLNMRLKNNFNLQNVLTDTFIPGKKMMVKSAKINYSDNVTECELVEISQDELIIVK